MTPEEKREYGFLVEQLYAVVISLVELLISKGVITQDEWKDKIGNKAFEAYENNFGKEEIK